MSFDPMATVKLLLFGAKAAPETLDIKIAEAKAQVELVQEELADYKKTSKAFKLASPKKLRIVNGVHHV